MKVKNNLIVFKSSGISAIENYVVGRYHMYNQVYYHPTSISYETLVAKLMLRLKDLYHNNFKFKCPPVYLIPFFQDEMVSNKEHFNLDEPSIYHYAKLMQEEDDPILNDLSRRFLNRDLFKYKVVEDEQQIEVIKNKLIEKGFDPRYYFQVERPVQVVYKRYGKQDMTAINILTNKGEIKELSDVSLIVKALSQSRYQTKGEITVFTPKLD
jgi:HD superfamily phosphohydrolase